ncbi:MAG: hypothetical protein IJM24_01350 [Clostridia bacterium]|nr:hypothetical protein [Clostridia bacterium]
MSAVAIAAACRIARIRSFNRALAHSTALSLIQPHSRSFNRILAHFFSAIFDFLNKKCDIRFFVPFHAHFSARSVMY